MADIKQYVNVDPTKADERKEIDVKRAGREVMLVATISPKKKGILVFFDLKSTAKNIVPSLEEANFSNDKLRHLRARAGGLPGRSTRAALTNGKGEAHLKIKLSEFGGDEFEVEAYIKDKKGKKKKSLQADKYILWRRVYYQVSRFKDGPKGAGRTGTLPVAPALAWASVSDEYKNREHNIELVDETVTDLITRRANVLSPRDSPNLKASARESYDPKREPLAMRVVLVNQLATPIVAMLNHTVAVKEGTPVTVTTTSRLWLDESLPITTDWAVQVDWRRDASDSWKTLDRQYLAYKGPTSFEINFRHIPKTGFFDFFREAEVRCKLRYLDGSVNGLSWYNSIWIAAENMHKGARSPGDKQQTTIHETGHFIGMVPAAQTTQYTGHGHQGGHCFTGLSATDQAAADYRGKSGTCVMFGENAASRLGIFCSVCDPTVRTRKVVLQRMPASW